LNPEAIFIFAQALAAAPANRGWCIGFARAVALALAVTYLAQLLGNTVPVEGGSFSSLGGITALFSQPANVMLGWTHYLAFDLFIGSWIAEDAGRAGVPHYAVIPILIATLVIGPVGLLIWFGVRQLHRMRTAA
jgi:Domain of unknown function (DUF4281)